MAVLLKICFSRRAFLINISRQGLSAAVRKAPTSARMIPAPTAAYTAMQIRTSKRPTTPSKTTTRPPPSWATPKPNQTNGSMNSKVAILPKNLSNWKCFDNHRISTNMPKPNLSVSRRSSPLKPAAKSLLYSVPIHNFTCNKIVTFVTHTVICP